MGVSPLTVALVAVEGYDFLHLHEQQLDRATDEQILQKALREDRVIVTFDRDFGKLLASSGASAPSIVLFRTSGNRPQQTAARLLTVLERYASELSSGAIVVVKNTRMRARRLPMH